MNKTMFFSFEHPITFERIYDFSNPDHPFNCYWAAEDSNPLFIKTTNYRVKKDEIMLSDEFGYNDDFRVSLTEFPNFLKRFDLL